MTVETSGPEEFNNKVFYEVWVDALTKPNIENYRQIVNDPSASMATALLWLTGVGFIGSLISGTLQSIFGVNAVFSDVLGSGYATSTSIFGVIAGAFASLFLTPLFSLLITGGMHLVARALGGSGSFEKMFSGFASFWVPISLINSVLGGIPLINCLTIFVSIYALVLSVISNQAVHGYDAGKAMSSSIGVPLLFGVLIFGCIVVLVILGVAAGTPFLENFANQFGMLLLT